MSRLVSQKIGSKHRVLSLWCPVFICNTLCALVRLIVNEFTQSFVSAIRVVCLMCHTFGKLYIVNKKQNVDVNAAFCPSRFDSATCFAFIDNLKESTQVFLCSPSTLLVARTLK